MACDSSGQPAKRWYRGETSRQPSLIRSSTQHQAPDPFGDENALRNSEVIPPSPGTLHFDTERAMAELLVIPPISDDGLPSSLPSRYTLAAKSSRLLDRYRPPPLPLDPRPVEDRLISYYSSSPTSVAHFGGELVTPRDSPERQMTFVRPPICSRSQTASIHGDGEPVRLVGEDRQASGAPKWLSASLPDGYAVRARPSVTGQKQPFPLLSPVLVKGGKFPPGQGDSVRAPQLTERENETRCMPTPLWHRKKKIIILLAVVFQIGIITTTAAVVAGVKDARNNMYKASTVIAGVLGAAAYIASILLGWALGLGHRRIISDHKEETAVSTNSNNKIEKWSVKPTGQTHQANPMQQISRHPDPIIDRTVQRPDNVEKSPVDEYHDWLSHASLPPSRPIEDGIEPTHERNNDDSRKHLTLARSQQPVSGSPLPSSNLLPSITGRHELEPMLRPVDAGAYRVELEPTLQHREHVPLSSDFGEVRELVTAGTDGVTRDGETIHELPANNEDTQQEVSQGTRRHNQHDTKKPQSPTSSGDDNDDDTKTTMPNAPQPQPPPRLPLELISAFPYSGPSQPSFSSYPPLSSAPSSSTSSSRRHHTSFSAAHLPAASAPSSSIITYPSPTHASPYPSPSTSALNSQDYDEREDGEEACSDTTSMREARTMKSRMKVRVWQKYMCDGEGE